MKKVNPVQDALEREIQDLLVPYPDPMGRTGFRKACRIGTRTSIYLLQSGLVPCENTGKQTRCYKIAKADVAAYLRRPPRRAGVLHPAQRLVQELPEPQAPGLWPERGAAGAPRSGSESSPTSTPIRRVVAEVPHFRGLQQHHEKEQGALRYDRGGGSKAQKAEEKELKVKMIASTCVLGPISGHGRCPFFMLY